jgi:hypothetical protein
MEPWIVRLREHLSRKKAKPPEPKVQKPIELELPMPSVSTSSVAGSWERIEVYRQRVERGEQLFHPLDCKLVAVRQCLCGMS